jgi:uncharacterized protein
VGDGIVTEAQQRGAGFGPWGARALASVPAVARIEITVSPGAVRSELVGRHGPGWRARVAAPPDRGRANAELVALLAGALNLTKTQVRVVAGHGSRRKIVEVDLDAAEVDRRLGR